MKKSLGLLFVLIFLVLLIGCNTNAQPDEPQQAVSETIVEEWPSEPLITFVGGEEIEAVINSEPVEKPFTIKPDDDMWFNLNSSTKYIYPYKNGYFYFIGQGHSSTLAYDKGDGKPQAFRVKGIDMNSAHLQPAFLLEDTLYFINYVENGDRMLYGYNLAKNKLIKMNANIFGWYVFFAEDRIYYVEADGEPQKVYTVDYRGKNKELIFELPENIIIDDYFAFNFYVHDDKLWFNYADYDADRVYSYERQGFAYYDLQKKDIKLIRLPIEFNWYDSIVLNNGYYYFSATYALPTPSHSTDHKYEDSFWRLNIDTFVLDQLNEEDLNFSTLFCKGYMVDIEDGAVYENGSAIYRTDPHGKREKIITSKELGGRYMLSIQIEGEHILVWASSGLYDDTDYYYAEIDINGNILKVIYDDSVA